MPAPTHRLVCLFLVLVVSACGGDDEPSNQPPRCPGSNGCAPSELGDMAVPVKSGCAGYAACIAACAGEGKPSYECTDTCDPLSSAGARSVFSTALRCGQSHCVGDADAGIGPCKLSPDGLMLVNEDGSTIMSTDPGTGMQRCGACLHDSLARLFGYTCSTMSSPDCNPGECTAATDACLTDS